MNHFRIASRIINSSAEGVLAVPSGQVIAHLGKILAAKYTIEMSYRSFADRIRGPWRDAIVDHWHDHAKDERKSTYDFAMKIVGLGGDPIQTSVSVPLCVANVEGFMKVLAQQELDAISACRELVSMTGDNTSLRLLAEETILMDAHHLDDLRRSSESMGLGAVE